jgi:hypothetical protein
MSDNLNLHLWVARRAEQGTLQAHADYVVENIRLLEQAVKYEADLAQQALDSRAELAAALDSQIEWVKTLREKLSVSEAKLEKAVQGLGESQEEIDQYIRQEYPSDHSLHERYRQRDFSANPARTTLAELKGQDDE